MASTFCRSPVRKSSPLIWQTAIVVERTRSRAGIVLGNLISHQGAILSQNGKFLDRFDQIDVLARLHRITTGGRC